MNKRYIHSIILGIIFILLPGIISAQSILMQDVPSEKPKLSFRFFHPSFEEFDFSSLTGLYELCASIPLNSKFNFVASLPYSSYKINYEDGETESGSGIGNVFVGMQMKLKAKEGCDTSATLGFYLPTQRSNEEGLDAAVVGLFSNFYEFEKSYPHTLSIYGNFAHHRIINDGFMYGVEAGPRLLIPTKDEGSDRNLELYLHYGGSIGYRIKFIDLKAEVTGIYQATGDMSDSSDRFEHMGSFGINWNKGKVRPGIFYTLFLEKESRDFISGVFGIRLDVIL